MTDNRIAMRVAGYLATPMVVAVLAGCNQPPAVNPWRDDSIPQTSWSTPSAEGVLAAGHEPVIQHRDIQTSDVSVYGAVPHYPLWWEDPFEDKGDGDGVFAWTYADYIGMPYSFSRYVLNTIAWPVSAIVIPPGTPMVSDSFIGPRGFDAEVGRSPDPTATSADFDRPDADSSTKPSTQP